MYTIRDRVLFFPAARVLIPPQELASEKFVGTVLEHITLGPPTKALSHSSHVAVRGILKNASRGLGYTTRVPEGWFVPWFSLLLLSVEDLDSLPAETIIDFDPPRPDWDRHFEQMVTETCLGVALIGLPPAHGAPHFLQFDIWVGRGTGWEEKYVLAGPLPWAYKPALVKDAPSGEQEVSLARTKAHFSETAGILVSLCRPLGIINEAHLLRPNLDFDAATAHRNKS